MKNLWKNENMKRCLVPAGYYAWSLILNFIIEALSRHSVSKAALYMVHSPIVFLYNALLISLIFLAVYPVRAKRFAFTVVTLLWLIGGVANCITLYTRVTPVCAADLTMIKDVIPIMTLYMKVWQAALIFIGLGLCIIFLVLWFLRSPRYEGEMKRGRRLLVTAAALAVFALITKGLIETDILSVYFSNVAYAYEDYGFPYGFMTSLFDIGMNQPSHYTERKVNRIIAADDRAAETEAAAEAQNKAENETENTAENVTESASENAAAGQRRPNILFLQLETFFDPTLLKGIELSEDPIPNFHALSDRYSSGYYNVPVVGAGTANTEFESITGMNMRYFGPGEYPYKTIMTGTTCDSMAYALKNAGYTAHAIHDNNAEFYGRNEVFANLGFDTFTSLETMNVTKTNYLGWADDSILTGCILDCLKSTEGPDYIYTISVQGHGQYPTEQVYEDPPIKVSGNLTEEKRNQWTYYVNQIHEMDEFIGELTAALSSYDEDIVLVMYGDHLPTMELTAKDVKTGYLYSTEYCIWDNMGLEQTDKNISAYQMGAVITERLGIHEGIMMKYHQNRMGTKDYLQDMETLQYDILYGEHYAYPNHEIYAPTQLQIGVRKVTVTDVENTMQDRCYVLGSNFTAYSQVAVNGKLQKTEYISSGALLMNNAKMQAGDEITVCQVSEAGTVLAVSEAYLIP